LEAGFGRSNASSESESLTSRDGINEIVGGDFCNIVNSKTTVTLQQLGFTVFYFSVFYKIFLKITDKKQLTST